MSRISIDSLIELYDIDSVIFGSNITMWTQDKFKFTFSKDIFGGGE